MPEYAITNEPDAEVDSLEHWHARDPVGDSLGHLKVFTNEFGERQIGNLEVPPEHHRKGIGTALWEAAGRPLHDPKHQTAEGKSWARTVGGDDRRYAASPWLPHRLNPDPTNPYDDEHYNPDRPRISWEPEDYHQEPIPDVRWPRGQKPTNLWRGLHIDLDHPQWADHPNVQGMKRILYGEQDTGGGLYAPSPSQGNLHPHPASPEGKALSQHILDFAEDVGQNVDTYREPWTEENDATRVPFTKIHDKSDPTWLGRHWTTDPEVADSYAYKTTPGRRGLSVLMRARWDGRGEDLSRANAGGSWPDENEINLVPGTQLDIHGLGIRHPDSVHNMYNSQYHNLLKGQDHERRTAGVEPFQMRMEHLDPHLVYDREREFSDDPWSGWRKRTVPLVEDVRRNGIGMPVTMATDGHLGILEDGNHRAAAAKILGLPTVPVRFQRANTRYLSRGGGVPLHPSVQQHLADHPEALLDHVERQPSWAQGERTAAWDDKLPKEQKCKYCAQQASKRIQHSEGMAYIPVCDKHLEKGKDAAARCTPGGEHDPSNINAIKDIRQARQAFRLTAAFDIEAAAPPGYEVHLHDTSGYGDGTAALHPASVKPTGNNWHAAIRWDKAGKITNLDTKPEHQGKGLGRALYEHVRDTWRPDLMHDHALSPEGEGFAKAVGGPSYFDDRDEYSRREKQNDTERKLPWEQRQELMRSRGWPERRDITAALEFQRGDIHPDYGPDPEHAISAHLDGEPVGRMLWYPDGELTQIEVHPDHRRQGIGTQMFNWAKRNAEPRLHHSPAMTDEGRRWAASMGYRPQEYTRVPEATGALWRVAAAGFHIHETQPGKIWKAYEGPQAPHDPYTPEIGKLVVDHHEGQPYVNWVSVPEKHRGRGIGQALWEQAGRPLHVPGAQTEEGKAWADKVGGDSLWWSGNEHLRESSLAPRRVAAPQAAFRLTAAFDREAATDWDDESGEYVEDPIGPPHLWLPTEVVDQYRTGEDRADPRHMNFGGTTSFHDLPEHIAEHGIQRPLEIYHDGEHGYLADGNNRLEVARQTGIPEMPVRLTYAPHTVEPEDKTPQKLLHPDIRKFLQGKNKQAFNLTAAFKVPA